MAASGSSVSGRGSSSLIDGLAEGFGAGAPHGVDEAFAVVADSEISVQGSFDGGCDLLGRQALAYNLAQGRLFVRRAAHGDLVELLAFPIDAQHPDVAHMVVAAGVDAAAHVDADR